jgi:hypothetical protein
VAVVDEPARLIPRSLRAAPPVEGIVDAVGIVAPVSGRSGAD